MKWEKDSRVNAKDVTFRETIVIFIAMMAFNGFHMWIYTAISAIWPDTSQNVTQYVLIMGGYVLIIAAAMTLFTALMRQYSMGRPMQRIGSAARRIAQGDFSVRVAPIRKNGKKDYIEVMIEDFNTMAEELGSIESLKDDFISNVSHEIKTPLSIIQNYTAALEDERLSLEQQKEYRATIIHATQKLSMLVTNILKMNKLENQEILPVSQPYDVSEQLRQSALAFVDIWEQKDIVFDADIEDDITVNADESMLDIVWNNLLSNAIKFTENGGNVKVTLKRKDGSALISVKDSGCGMSEETCKRIFDKFYQGDTSHSKEGNGLGMALAKRVVDLCGGTITVDSALGKGTTFTVRLKTV